MLLPQHWPGRPLVRKALTFARLIGAWSPVLDHYAGLPRWRQKMRYGIFRSEWYYQTKIDDPDGNRIGR